MRHVLMSLIMALAVAVSLPAFAEVWDNCGGVIEYDGDDGRLHRKKFVSYLTTKHDFIWYRVNGKRMRMHVRHPESFTVYGELDPVTITLRSGKTLDVMLDDTFVKEVTGLESFSFKGTEGAQHIVPWPAVRKISFGGQ